MGNYDDQIDQNLKNTVEDLIDCNLVKPGTDAYAAALIIMDAGYMSLPAELIEAYHDDIVPLFFKEYETKTDEPELWQTHFPWPQLRDKK